MAPPPHPAARADIVRVRLVGSFAASRAGDAEPVRLGSRKARRLLALLAVEPDRLVPLDRIVDVLWPVDPPRRPGRQCGHPGQPVACGARQRVHRRRPGRLPAGSAAVRPASIWTRRPRWSPSAQRLLPRAPAARPRRGGARRWTLLGAGGVLARRARRGLGASGPEPSRRRLLREARHAAAAAGAARPVTRSRPGDVAEAAIRRRPARRGRAPAADDRAPGWPASRPGRWPSTSGCGPSWPTSWASTRPRRPARCTWRSWRERGPHGRRPPVRAPARPGAGRPRARSSWPPDPGLGGGLRRHGRGRAAGRRRGRHRQDRGWPPSWPRRGRGRPAARCWCSRCYASERSLFLQPLVDALGRPLAALPRRRGCGSWPARARRRWSA